MSAVNKVGGEEVESGVGDTIVRRKSVDKDWVVNGVKGCREIEKDEGRDFLFVGGKEKIILNSE